MPRIDPIVASWAAAAFVAITAIVTTSIVYRIDSRPVVDYGASPRSWFSPDHAKVGQKIQQCFAEINWHRPQCPGEYHWSWRTSAGDLKTGKPHIISNPPGAKPRQLLGKCREFVVPDFADIGPNRMTETYAANKCSWWHEWSPIRADGPTDIALTVE